MLYGYCGGVFGRDHYNHCRVEAVGVDWVVVRQVDFDCEGQGPYPEFAQGDTIHQDLEEYTIKTPAEAENEN